MAFDSKKLGVERQYLQDDLVQINVEIRSLEHRRQDIQRRIDLLRDAQVEIDRLMIAKEARDEHE